MVQIIGKNKRKLLVFEVNKFYIHGESGTMIAILCEVDTYAFGKSFIVEECIPVNDPVNPGVEHYISSIIQDGKDHSKGWVEIGKAEWLKNFPRILEIIKTAQGN